MPAHERPPAVGEASDRLASPVLPTAKLQVAKSLPRNSPLHPAFYILTWIGFSSSVILFNKWILDTLKFGYPVILTTYHLTFATVVTQIMARVTTLLDGRKSVKMTSGVYLRSVAPIGIFFSLSLICGNLTYMYLSVAFIQMLKATTPVAALISSWTLGVSQANLKQFLNVSAIVIGVIIASVGEIHFVTIGVMYQLGGIIFEAIRLAMMQRLLSSADLKMDPLVFLYYFAPICAVINAAVALIWEFPKVTMADVYNVGIFTFLLNGLCAFMLNMSVVFLIDKTSAVVLTLCGVVKDVLLVVASMMIWGTQVTALQIFGYSIALCGMVYYKLGYQQLKGYVGATSRQWANLGVCKLMLRKLAVTFLIFFVMFILYYAPAHVPSYNPVKLSDEVSSRFDNSGAQ